MGCDRAAFISVFLIPTFVIFLRIEYGAVIVAIAIAIVVSVSEAQPTERPNLESSPAFSVHPRWAGWLVVDLSLGLVIQSLHLNPLNIKLPAPHAWVEVSRPRRRHATIGNGLPKVG